MELKEIIICYGALGSLEMEIAMSSSNVPEVELELRNCGHAISKAQMHLRNALLYKEDTKHEQ